MKSRVVPFVLIALMAVASTVSATPVFERHSEFVEITAGKSLEATNLGVAAQLVAEDFALTNLRATGAETFQVTQVQVDQLGLAHTRLQQYINGLEVVGAQLLVHSDIASGMSYLINGDFALAKTNPEKAIPMSLNQGLVNSFGHKARVIEQPTLVYLLHNGSAVLSWKIRVAYVFDNGQPQDSDFFFDAVSGKQLSEHPRVHTAKDIATYDANNVSYNSPSMPGTLLCTETQNNCGDSAAQDAHDGASDVYDYYQTKFGRDSLNDGGMQLVSSVHVQSNWNNAAWYNNQMIYGDGDGSTFSPLSGDLDVVAHELTHGVTNFTSNLLYQNESGALNEGMSDIFGASAEAWVEGGINSTTWLLGEDIYTPGTPGDALRYMDNPTADGSSADYYPERNYPSCSPNQFNDYCGVHTNSGIANLAYVLLVEGGTHPRGKTSVNVTGIGLSKAEQIFYRANTVYMTASTNFAGARTATAQAAVDLYGTTEEDAVNEAWDAVGVPGGSGGGGGGGGGGTCTDNNIWTGTLSSGNLVTPNCSASGTFNGVLECTGAGTADLDLYLDKESCSGWFGCSFSSVASSATASCGEAVNGYSGSSGTYRWRVVHYSGGSEDIRLCTNQC